MKNRTLLAVVLLLVLIAIVVVAYLHAQEITLHVSWPYYPDYGSDDAVWMRVNEARGDTSAVSVIGIVPITDTLFIVEDVKQDGRWRHYALSAEDTAGNISALSEFASYKVPLFDGTPPVRPQSPIITRPNPASSIVIFTYAQPDTVHIYNVLGQKVDKVALPSGSTELTYNAGHLPTGVYYYHTSTFTGKFTVVR